MSVPPDLLAPNPDADRRRHDRQTAVTVLRLRIQVLHRLARRQDGPDWPRMVDGLAALDADLSTLLGQIEHREEIDSPP